jgi:hypothetical protein
VLLLRIGRKVGSEAHSYLHSLAPLAALTLEVSWRITGFKVPQSSESSASSAKAKEGICPLDKIPKEALGTQAEGAR